MKSKRIFSYGVCESCKNCKHEKFAGFIILFQCRKDKKYKRWCNKCHLYKTKRKYARIKDEIFDVMDWEGRSK